MEAIKNLSNQYFQDSMFNETIMERILEFSKILTDTKKYDFIGCGRTRFCIGNSNFVYKLPTSEWGFFDNDREHKIFSKHGKKNDSIPYAKCKLIHFKDIPIILMERVHLLNPKNMRFHYRNTNWVSFVDSGQIGYNKKGELLAYDYSDSTFQGKISGSKEFAELLYGEVSNGKH